MKKFLAGLLIIGTLVGAWYGITHSGNNKDKNEQVKENKSDVLSKFGFSEEEITNIRSTFNDESVNKLITLESRELIDEMINAEKYDNQKLDDYLEFYNKNKNIKISDVVKLVNKDIHKIENLEYDDVILGLIDEKYYIYNYTVRYVDYYKGHDDLSTKDIITNVNSNLDRPFYTDIESTDMSKGNLVIVNKYYALSKDYEPSDLVLLDRSYVYGGSSSNHYMTKEAAAAFEKMVDDAKKEGITLYSRSPYRSYTTQYNTYWGYVNEDGREKADTYSARPGNSEHQTGLAIDINSFSDYFGDTKEGKWLNDNAHKYGFILRYPKGKEYITGYQYEPWHFRYVGVDVATEIYNLDITYEEYYAYYLK